MTQSHKLDRPPTGYCVHWRSLLTGLTGCGAQGLPKAVAERVRDTLNREFVGQFEHWVEAVAAPEEAIP